MSSTENTDSDKNDDTWPAEIEGQNWEDCGVQDIKIYYYLHPDTAKIDKNITLRTMIWLFRSNDKLRTKNLSAYFSIMNVFTYPALKKIADKLPNKVGIRLLPIQFDDATWPKEMIPNREIPLSKNEQLLTLAAFTLLLSDYKSKDTHNADVEEIMNSLGLIGDTNNNNNANYTSIYSAYVIWRDSGPWRPSGPWGRMSVFLASKFHIALSKYIFDNLVLEAAAAKNEKAKYVLQRCLAKMPSLAVCRQVLEEPKYGPPW